MLFGCAWFVLSYNKYRNTFTRSAQNKHETAVQHTTIHDPKLQQYQYHTALPSKQYSTYTVTIASFSCLPPSRSTLFARDPHFPLGMPFKLLGYIYTIPTIYIFLYGTYIIRTSTVIRSDDIYIYFYAVISTSSERHGTAMFWRSPSAARTRTIGTKSFCFLFLVLFYFSRPFAKKD